MIQAEIRSFDDSFGGDLRGVVQVCRNAVILREMIERSAGKDGELIAFAPEALRRDRLAVPGGLGLQPGFEALLVDEVQRRRRLALVGLEPADALWADLSAALAAADR